MGMKSGIPAAVDAVEVEVCPAAGRCFEASRSFSIMWYTLADNTLQSPHARVLKGHTARLPVPVKAFSNITVEQHPTPTKFRTWKRKSFL